MVENWSNENTRFGVIGTAHVAFTRHTNPTQAEWDGYLESLVESLPRIKSVFVYTLGGGPDPRMRKQITEMWRAHPPQPHIAIVTPSSVVRVIVTAVNYFMKEPLKLFAPEHLEAAFSFLGYSDDERVGVRAKLVDVRPWLETVETQRRSA